MSGAYCPRCDAWVECKCKAEPAEERDLKQAMAQMWSMLKRHAPALHEIACGDEVQTNNFFAQVVQSLDESGRGE